MKTIRLFSAAVLSPLCVPLLFFLAGTLYSGYTNGCCGHTEKFISDTASVGLAIIPFPNRGDAAY
jgi:hypothetical protein